METIYDDFLYGIETTLLCESGGSSKPSRFAGASLPAEGLPFPLLTHLHFHAMEWMAEAMTVTFRRYPLPSFLDNLQLWYELAMDNESGCFGRNPMRRDVAEVFYDAIRKLMEATYVAFCPRTITYLEHGDGDLHHHEVVHWDRDKPLILTQAEFENPLDVIDGFRKKYLWEFLRMELWDWLNAAITSDAEHVRCPETRGKMMDFYVHTNCMVEGMIHATLTGEYE